MTHSRAGRQGRLIPITATIALLVSLLAATSAPAASAEETPPPTVASSAPAAPDQPPPGEEPADPAATSPAPPVDEPTGPVADPEDTTVPTEDPQDRTAATEDPQEATAAAEPGVLAGVVTGPDGSGLPEAGVEVLAFSPDDGELVGVSSTTTDDTGGYSITGLTPGSYRLVFRAPDDSGLLDEWWDDQPAEELADPIDLADGSDLPELSARLTAGSTIAGVVSELGGGPMADLEISLELETPEGWSTLTSTTTDDDGGYLFEGVHTGSYRLSVEVFEQPQRRIVSLTSDTALTQDIAVPSGGWLSGKVTPAPAGPDADGYLVYVLNRAGSRVASTRTDRGGAYTAKGLGAGSYTVGVLAPGRPWRYLGGSASLKAASYLALDTDQRRTGVDLVLGGGTVAGTVKAPDGKPLAAAGVTLVQRDGGGAIYTETTSAGRYTFAGLPAGRYGVLFGEHRTATASYFSQWAGAPASDAGPVADDIWAASDEIYFAVGQNQALVKDATLRQAGELRGTLATGALGSLGDATVTVYRKTATGWQEVDRTAVEEDPAFRITGLPAGSYYLQADGWADGGQFDYWWKAAPAAATASAIPVGDGRIVTLGSLAVGSVVAPTGSVTGRLRPDPAGAYEAHLSSVDLPVRRSVEVAGDGSFVLTGVPAGRYTLAVKPEDGLTTYYPGVLDRAAAATITVAAAAVRLADFGPIIPTGSLTGVVTVPDEASVGVTRPLVDAEVALAPAGGDPTTSVTTDGDGRYSFTSALVPGARYEVTVTEPEDGDGRRRTWTSEEFEGDDADTLDLALPWRFGWGTVEGTVTGEGAGQAGVEVTAVDPAGVAVASTHTATDGSFGLNLRPGSYTLRFGDYAAPGGYFAPAWLGGATSAATADRIDVVADETLTTVDAALTRAGSLTGAVTAVRDGRLLWVPGAEVALYTVTGEKVWTTASGIESPGSYAFSVPAGVYKVCATPPAGGSLVANCAPAPGAAATGVTLGKAGAFTVAAGADKEATDIWLGGSGLVASVPTISGKAQVGQTLTATAGTWLPPGVALSYQWRRDGADITGATQRTYRVAAADLGRRLSIKVTGTAAGSATVVKTSAATAAVIAGVPTTAVPTITGTIAVGSVLTARPGTWTAGTAFTYQWYVNGKAVSKATKATFKPTSSHAGRRLMVKVTGRLAGYPAASRTSSATGKVMKAGSPKIKGTPAVGSTLTASRGSWTSKVSTSYRWLRDGVAIGGATKGSYRLSSSDAGKRISLQVTGKRSGYATVVRVSAATPKVVSAPNPKISGAAFVGSTLTAVPGTWSPGTVFSYQWLRSGKTISRATGATYKVAGGDHGKKISVRVTGRQAGWATVSRTSPSTAKAMKAGTPKISGSARVGSTLKVKAGSWTSKVKLSYQWLRDSAAIKGGTRSSYTPTPGDLGKKLAVRVTGKRSGYPTVARTSAMVTVGLGALKVGRPSITGTLKVGSRLTANPGSWSSGTSFSYQWRAGDLEIPGATSRTYVVRWEDIDNPLSVRITGSKPGYASVSRGVTFNEYVPDPLMPLYVGGTLRPGKDFPVGTYTAEGGAYCYWERRSKSGSSKSGIIASGPWSDGQVIVTIKATDPYFYVQACGKWERLPAPGHTESGFDDGDHAVGRHIPAGTYLAQGGKLCYWWRLTEAGTELAGAEAGQNGILTRGPIHDGRVIVTILPTDRYFISTGCGWWSLLTSDTYFPYEPLGDGDHAVNIHLHPGLWRTTTSTKDCYFEGGSDFTRANGTYQGWTATSREVTIEVEATDIRFTSVGCGKWERVEPATGARSASGDEPPAFEEAATAPARQVGVSAAAGR